MAMHVAHVPCGVQVYTIRWYIGRHCFDKGNENLRKRERKGDSVGETEAILLLIELYELITNYEGSYCEVMFGTS